MKYLTLSFYTPVSIHILHYFISSTIKAKNWKQKQKKNNKNIKKSSTKKKVLNFNILIWESQRLSMQGWNKSLSRVHRLETDFLTSNISNFLLACVWVKYLNFLDFHLFLIPVSCVLYQKFFFHMAKRVTRDITLGAGASMQRAKCSDFCRECEIKVFFFPCLPCLDF